MGLESNRGIFHCHICPVPVLHCCVHDIDRSLRELGTSLGEPSCPSGGEACDELANGGKRYPIRGVPKGLAHRSPVLSSFVVFLNFFFKSVGGAFCWPSISAGFDAGPEWKRFIIRQSAAFVDLQNVAEHGDILGRPASIISID